MKSRCNLGLFLTVTIVATALVTGSGTAAEKKPAAVDYPNNTITIVVPTTAGGGYDLGARNVARFLPKYLPKKVNVIVDNMPGAGQMIGVHSVYAAKPDGYTIGAFNAIGALMSQFVRSEEVKFDMNKFIYLGLWQQDTRAIGVSNNMTVKTWGELVKRSAQKPIVTGTGGLGTGQHIDPLMIEAVSDLKLKYIHYDGSAQIEPAMGRKEIEMEVAQVATIQNLVDTKIGRAFCIIDKERYPLTPTFPTALEVGMPKAMYDKLSTLPFFGVDRVIAAPPGTDPAIVEILRKAVWQTFQDPEYLAQVKKMKGENNPIQGKDYQLLVDKKIQSAKANKALVDKLKF
jgi:tripartite-type tricarboxylate transporter receptor subunit TctC